MKYTDGLFEFPIRVYDGLSLKKAIKQEEDMEIPRDGEWVEGTAEVPFNEIKGMIDYFSKGRPIEEVYNEGFDCCIIMTNSFGDFICNLPKKLLKERLNTFAEKYTSQVEELVEEEMENKQNNIPKKPSFWQKFRR